MTFIEVLKSVLYQISQEVKQKEQGNDKRERGEN